MGAVFSQPRIIITDNLVLQYRNSFLTEVREAYDIWLEQGQKMGLTIEDFGRVLMLGPSVVGPHFELFDTDKNGLVDAFEVFSGWTVLSRGDDDEKAQFLFQIFDFDYSSVITRIEMTILMQAACRGLCKLAGMEPPSQEELEILAENAFKFADKDLNDKISIDEFVDWVKSDRQLQDYLDVFARSYDISEANAMVTKLRKQQIECFKDIYDPDTKEALATSFGEDMRQVLGKPSEEEMVELLKVITRKRKGYVHLYDFLEAIDLWNIFNVADVNGDGELNIKELKLLLWLYLKEEPDDNKVETTMNRLDTNNNRVLERIEWVRFCFNSHL